jgi:hypothetical protein
MAARRVVGEVGTQDSEERLPACLTMKKMSRFELDDMQGAFF